MLKAKQRLRATTTEVNTDGEGRLKRIIRWGGEFLLLALVVVGIMFWQERNLLASESASPNFQLPSLTTNVPEPLYQPGERTLVYFFAPWCSICRVSMGNLNTLDGDYQVKAVALSYQSVDEVAEFIEDLDVTAPVLLGHDDVMRRFNISAFPTYYVIDEQGLIASKSMGYSSEIGLKLRAGG